MLQVDALEQVILSVCLKHHGVGDILIQLGQGEESSHDPLLEAVFVYINRLERRLQVSVIFCTAFFPKVGAFTVLSPLPGSGRTGVQLDT